MGSTLKSRLHFEGKTYDGEALLETAEILFRGERRLVIPLAKIKSVTAREGRLHVKFGGGEAALDLGPQAAKWAEKISNPKSVVQKLGVKPGQQVALVHFDDDAFAADLEKAGAQVSKGRAKKNSDAIVYGANTRADLDRLKTLRASLASNGALWVIRPKGVKEITEAEVMAAGKAAGMVDVKVVRFSDTHTAEKFVIPLEKRGR
ncbi:MAG TPA: DUF3052 family protein [Thermoanaerobaculia bacterium]|jgi:hypothetical protein|nr:DUF3052 family protein [Thermoanaerobaculia bacterium]